MSKSLQGTKNPTGFSRGSVNGQASLQDQDLVLRLAEEVATLESAIILISTDQDGLIDALAEAYGSI